MTAADRQAIRDRAEPWLPFLGGIQLVASASTVGQLARDVLALDAALSETEAERDEAHEWRMRDVEAVAARAEAAEKERDEARRVMSSREEWLEGLLVDTGAERDALRDERDELRLWYRGEDIAHKQTKARVVALEEALRLAKERATLILRLARSAGHGLDEKNALSKIEHEAEHWLGLARAALADKEREA